MNKKFLILMIMGILLLATVSAFEFDNVGQYDPNTRTMTIVNGFGLGADIATIQLTSSLHEKVPAGYGQVAQFNMAVFDDYNQAFKELELYHRGNGNGGNGNGQFNRDYEWKFKTTEKTKVDDWVEECYTNQTTGNETCIMVIDGWHWEWLPVWETIHNSDWMEGDVLTVGLFTIVEVNDSVEWIPNFFGVRIDEWATWTADLNVDLVSYWKLNVGSSNQIDSVNSNDGTVDGATYTASGKIGGAYNFDGTNDRINISNDASFNSLSAYSISAWIYRDGTSDDFIFSKLEDSTEHNKNYEFGIESNKIFLLNGNGGGYNKVLGTSTLSSSTWYFVVGVWDGTDIKVYLDGSLDCSPISSTVVSFGTTAIALGTRQTGYAFFDGKIDEVGFWDRALTSTEITQLYNGGTGITYDSLDNDAPIVTQISPANNAKESTTGSKNFTCYGSDDTNFTSMEFYIDGSLNQTNSSGLNNTNYTFTTSLTEETYLWSCLGNDNDGESTSTVNRTLTIDTTPFIEFVSPTFANASNLLVSYIPVNISLTETYFENLTINFYKDGVLNESYFIDDDTRFYNKSGCTCAEWEVNATVWTTTDQSNSTETRIFTIDPSAPTINIISPTGTYDSLVSGDTLYLSGFANDSNMDTCWYDYNNTNTTFSCTTETLFNESFTQGNISQLNLTVWTNDSVGNVGTGTTGWDYKLFGTAEEYSAATFSSNNENFLINISYDSLIYLGLTANLVYNGTNYSATATTSGNITSIEKTLNIPTVAVTENLPFYWEIFLNDGSTITTITTSSNNQSVSPLYAINITDLTCQAGYFEAVNFTFYDAENGTALSDNVDYNFQYGTGNYSSNLIYGEFLNITSFRICINSSVEDYKIGYGEVQYFSVGYSERRFYMYEDQTLSNSTTREYGLGSLLSADSTSFIFEIKNTYLNPYTDKLIALLRWYPGDNEYKVSEMAKTDADGKTVMKVKTEDVDYRVGVYEKDGTLIKLTDAVRMACLVNPCTYSLKIVQDPDDYYSVFEVETSLIFDEDTDRFVYSWNDPEQITSEMRLEVYKLAGNQDILICNETTSSYTGVMVCSIGTYTGDFYAKVYRSASPEKILSTLFHTNRDGVESSFGLFLAVILALATGLIGIASPVIAVILLIVGLIPALLFGSISIAIYMGIATLGGIVIHYMKKSAQ